MEDSVLEFKTNDDRILYPVINMNKLFDAMYPIDSIYISMNNTNPSELFGGIWESICKGRTLIGVDEEDSDFDVVELKGGSKNHLHNLNNHTHTSTAHTHNISSHTHNLSTTGGARIRADSGTVYSGDWSDVNVQSNITRRIAVTGVTDSAAIRQGTGLMGRTDGITTITNTGATTSGATGAPSNNNTNLESNLTPFITCYMWRRVA